MPRRKNFSILLMLMVCVMLAALAAGRWATQGNAATQADMLNRPAPELVGGPWLNTPGNQPIKLADRRGQVTVVEYWTFACVNCLHNLPSYANWQRRFADKGVVVIGVHTPETDAERVTANVAARVKKLGITYPILVDENHENWNRWGLEAWPTVFLVDQRGRIRYRWVGELNYRSAGGEARMAELIEQLLKENG